MENINILIEAMTNTAKIPGGSTTAPFRAIANASFGNILSLGRSKLASPDVLQETSSGRANDLCDVGSEVRHLKAALERASAPGTQEDSTCVQQGRLGSTILTLVEQIECKVAAAGALRCIEVVEGVFKYSDPVLLQKDVMEAAKPFQALIMRLKPLINTLRSKEINNVYSTELSECLRSLSESIVTFFTAVQSMLTRAAASGNTLSAGRSEHRAADSVVRVLDRVIVACSAVYSLNARGLRSIDPSAGCAYAGTLRTPLEAKLVNTLIDLRLRVDTMYQSIVGWAASSEPVDPSFPRSIDAHAENVRSIVADVNSAFDQARRIGVYDQSPVKKVFVELCCKDIGEYALKTLTALRTVSAETTPEARTAAACGMFRLFCVMTRQAADVLYTAVVSAAAAGDEGIALGCFGSLVRGVALDLAKAVETTPVAPASRIKEALVNSEMNLAKYISLLDSIIALPQTQSQSVVALPSGALKAVADALRSAKASLSDAAKKTLSTQQAAPAGSLTHAVVEDVIDACLEAVLPCSKRMLAYRVSFARDSEYLCAYLASKQLTAHVKTFASTLIVEYVRALLLTLQGLQGFLRRLGPSFPFHSAAEERSKAFASHMQSLVALTRGGPEAAVAARGGAEAAAADVLVDIEAIARLMAPTEAARVAAAKRLPPQVAQAYAACLRTRAEEVAKDNVSATYAAVPTTTKAGVHYNINIADFAHKIEKEMPKNVVGNAGKQVVALATELARSLAVVALDNAGAEVTMAACEGVVRAAEALLKINARTAEKFIRASKFAYTALMLININMTLAMNAFRTCAPEFVINRKECRAQFEEVTAELVSNVIDVVCAIAAYEI